MINFLKLILGTLALRFRSFLMIKGISDQPAAGPEADRGSVQRAQWKKYAAAAAAALARGLMEEMSPNEMSRLSAPELTDHERRTHGEHDAYEVAVCYISTCV
jgi:hypothetical protein